MSGGVDRVQVRARELEGAALVELVAALAAAARRERPGVEILVNRRVDAALAAGADGVHLGFDAMDVAAARRVLGKDALVGVSTHCVDEVRAAAGASYVHLAPVFAPLSKPATREALGLAAVESAARAEVPVIAQGGIDASNAGAVCAAGAAGVAVTGAVLMADDPASATAALRRALGV